MARRTQTYAIRLAVEGGGQVKAELVSVGQSGEQSLKRIETAGDRASGGLRGLGRQAELLRTGIRTLGGALIGAATVGGLGALIDRSISAADAIGKTADKIGVGVEALQELRFAAKASGVEQQTLDMALQRFTRRAAEAAQGTGEAKDALAQMGIALRDQSGNLRQSEDLLADVADAFARIEDPAERVRLAFKLFDSEGVALVNLLSDGSGALEEMRERARDLGIVLDEHLVRDAERARTELDTLSQVISANLTQAALEAAPVIADLSSWLADVAGKAGIAWERLFDAPEEKSLRTLRYELDLASSTIAKLEGRIHEVRFPDNIAYGATGGPEFATTVVATGSGHEKRNVNWSEARGRWDVASGLKKQAQIDELIAFFRARRGRAYGFRFKDWTDHRAPGQLLGTGDDALTQFQLVKQYPSGSVIEVRTITKPVAGTVQVYLDGLEQASGWSVDTTTGLLTFSTAPAVGIEVTADFEFDVPVRFDTDHMAVTIETYQLHNWQQIPIVELRT